MDKYLGIESLAPSLQTAAKTMYAAFEILHEEKEELPGKEIIERIPGSLNINEWEMERYEKSGYVRWQSNLYLFMIDFSKAGYLRKQVGTWLRRRSSSPPLRSTLSMRSEIALRNQGPYVRQRCLVTMTQAHKFSARKQLAWQHHPAMSIGQLSLSPQFVIRLPCR